VLVGRDLRTYLGHVVIQIKPLVRARRDQRSRP
jgi:hypothetical protein